MKKFCLLGFFWIVLIPLGCVDGVHLAVPSTSEPPDDIPPEEPLPNIGLNGSGAEVARSNFYVVYGSTSFVSGAESEGNRYQVIGSDIKIGRRRLEETK